MCLESEVDFDLRNLLPCLEFWTPCQPGKANPDGPVGHRDRDTGEPGEADRGLPAGKDPCRGHAPGVLGLVPDDEVA